MATNIIMPSFTLKVGEGGNYRWRDKKRFIGELISRGLKESQIDKVWRMYSDRDFILRHGCRGTLGMEYVITRARMSRMAHELGIHGKSKSRTAVRQLRQLIMQAECFVTWISDKGMLLQFASPMYQTKDVLTGEHGSNGSNG